MLGHIYFELVDYNSVCVLQNLGSVLIYMQILVFYLVNQNTSHHSFSIQGFVENLAKLFYQVMMCSFFLNYNLYLILPHFLGIRDIQSQPEQKKLTTCCQVSSRILLLIRQSLHLFYEITILVTITKMLRKSL